MTEEILDVQGLKCPLPVLKARKLIKSLNSGAQLLILTTDPAAQADFLAFCEAAGHSFISHAEEGEVHHIRLEIA